MKLQSSKQKQKKTIIIAVVAVLALALIAGLVFGVIALIDALKGNNSTMPEEPLTTLGINVSRKPDKVNYFVGEPCDWSGIEVQVVMNKQSETYYVGADELEITGFDSSVPAEEQKITVKYGEYTTSFTVKISEKITAPQMVSIRLSDNFQKTWTLADWNSPYTAKFYGVEIICTYSDGHEERVEMKKSYVVGGLPSNITSTGELEFVVQYNGFQTTVTVTITN